MSRITDRVKEELTDMITDVLSSYSGHACDLHHEVFNTDYFIVGTFEAKVWLEKHYGIFEAIYKVKEYEQDNFGEVTTDVSDPEKLVNMLVYILGEEILAESSILQDHWNEVIDTDVCNEIIAEFES